MQPEETFYIEDYKTYDHAKVNINLDFVASANVRIYYKNRCASYNLPIDSYEETSIISLPNADGTRTTETFTKDVFAKIKSLDFGTSNPVIETVVAQKSHGFGVILVVKGDKSGTDNVRRTFTQTLFLAPRENMYGYFLKNDVIPFAFVPETCFGDEEESKMESSKIKEKESEMVNKINESLNERTYASIVKMAAVSGTSKRNLVSSNLSAKLTASCSTSYVSVLKGVENANAEEIAAKFLKLYYRVLFETPEFVKQFYNEMSSISWQNCDDKLTEVTTLNGILDKIRSPNFANSMPKIESVVAQDSYKSGIIVVVTGARTGTGDVRNEFTQIFFLAPQESGEYFVRNDIALFTLASVEPEMVKKSVNEQSEYFGHADLMTLNSSDSSGATTEKTYASFFSRPVSKPAASGAIYLGGTATQTSIRKVGPTDISAEPIASPPTSNIGGINSRKVEGHSVYIQGLPLNATVTAVTNEFRKFGPIKDGSVQVKYHQDRRHCYGFVEFQSLDSMENAIKGSPLKIMGHDVVALKKNGPIRAGSENTKSFTSERGKLHNSVRGLGHFGVRGYGRNQFGNDHKPEKK